MSRTIELGKKIVGDGNPCYIVAEIGINHNGDLGTTKRLIDTAIVAGCDAVKFQKRTPELCVPDSQKNLLRETPWGLITYMEYRKKVEFGEQEYDEIDRYCKERDIQWFASCWDIESVNFIEHYRPVAYKLPSACITDLELINRILKCDAPVILSTGMSTQTEIDLAVSKFPTNRLIITHCTSTYPCKKEELNLSMISTLKDKFNCPIGYSGHEVGLQTSLAAVVLGANLLERHITLDRAMWGSDQAASVEPHGLIRLVRDIRVIESAMGDGVKHVYNDEIPIRNKLRRIN